ncbi:glycosyltransferase [Rhodococcoides fascians]|uniref:glycosyltransferase n=1 Tax=Rhodococcoides fascians TaxID=1828 RepID=UPI00050C0181|nr:glycosyltransferase [Rhodococcus fascians]
MSEFLFLTHSAAPAGAELSLLRLAAALNTDAEVIFTADGPMVQRFRAAGIRVQVVAGNSGSARLHRGRVGPVTAVRAAGDLLQTGWKVGEKARQANVRVVVARSTKALLIGWVASRRARVPLVWSIHDHVSRKYFGRLTALLIRTLGRLLASGYIANSSSTLETVWTGKKPTVVVPPGLVLTHTRQKSFLTARHSELFDFVSVGRIAPWKGQDIFIRAFAKVFADNPNVRATIVGGPLFGEIDYETSLKSLVSGLGIEGSVTFTGHVDDVYPFLDSADVLVHCSVLPEPFGSVIIEGMATGCAVIATNAGGPAEVITAGVDGLLVPCGDEEALAATLKQLATDSDLCAKLIGNGLLRARDFDIDVLATRTSDWLNRLTWDVKR